ncbi:NAD-dependent epimerase/dehydratase family protein [Alphaproteobacteria bacterium]|nr:NAD-dependent epimerase/dehydratase family protein [Alphaproteobacteria bacterium]
MSPNLHTDNLPTSFVDEEELEEFMTRPRQELIDDLGGLDGDIMILGVSGKMGPTLARLAKRAAPGKTVTGVARFNQTGIRDRLNSWGVETIKADLLDRKALGDLPKPENIIFMAGRKFGSSGSEDLTWAMNVHCPALVAEAFRDQKIVAFSTACVYPFVPVSSGGAKENLAPNPPGEYAQSCVGRERMFQYFSSQFGTPGRLIRLSYAIDLRYGVLFDVADAVLRGKPIDVTMGHANVIWQGEANEHALRALLHCTAPTSPLNVSGSHITSIRWLAEQFGSRLGKPPHIIGEEAKTAWLIDTDRSKALFGDALVPMATLIDWVADWVAQGKATLGKPTHFEARDGAY